ncbi:MAG: LegC family aminotransferase [Opitutae bacterium]|nr:LegC family aminotransferase [Opitutae bacterium]
MSAFVPLSVPNLGGNEWKYVKECLDSGWVSSVGSYVNRFEAAMAQAAGTRYAVATASGTAALHTALMVLGVLRDEEVLMPSLTFIAPANAVRYLGAWPVFMDCDPVYWQMDPNKVQDFLRRGCERRAHGVFNRATGRRVAALLPVHVLGHPCEMPALLALAEEWNLPIIEDATESLGSRCAGRPTGSIGRIGCFSFNGNKIITTGGGGMLTTDDAALAERARYLTTQAKDDPVEFVHGAVGYNYRLTNLQAAVGCAQLEQLPEFLKTKRRIAAAYDAALGSTGRWILPKQAPWAETNWWLYTALMVASAKTDRRAVLASLQDAGIQTRPFWQPMHLSPAHRECPSWHCSVAEDLWQRGLSLPCSTSLDASTQERVIAALLALN